MKSAIISTIYVIFDISGLVVQNSTQFCSALNAWPKHGDEKGGDMKIKHKLWLEKNGRVIFGPGRFELLEAVEECQSLSAAAKKLKMSYRAAWGRLRASEDRLGMPLVELTDNRQGMRLTEEARKLKNAFVELERKMDELLEEYQAKLP
jgi:molybdate transport system regulatory protein